MGSASVQPSIAVSRLLRQKRKEHRLTLREVSDRLAARGNRIPTSTLLRIEQGKLDPGVRRLHLLLDLYHVPPHLVADLMEIETLAGQPPPEADLDTLYRTGLEHWKKGDVARGLAHLFAIRERVPDGPPERLLRQKATLSFAVAARNLGKFRLAKQIVDDLICEPPDESLLARVFVLASSLWRGLGSIEMALALVRHAATRVPPGGEKETAWVLHQEAKLLLELGRIDEARRVLDGALARYRSIPDAYGEARAQVLGIAIEERREGLEQAIEHARQALAFAERCGHGRVAIAATLELGRLLVRSGAVEDGLNAVREGLGQAVLVNDRFAEFLAHYQLWKIHERLGDSDRATFELKAAAYFVQLVDDDTSESAEVRALIREGKA